MATKSLLINFAGYPVSPRMLAPDNGLASLAGSLIEKGHQTTIFDYAVVDTIERFFPHEHRDELYEVIDKIKTVSEKGMATDEKDVKRFYELDRKITDSARSKIKDIALEIGDFIEKNSIDFIGMKLWMGDGFEGSMTIARYLKKRFPALPVFGGGPHVDWFMERILDECQAFDLLVYGDGEETITMLADYVEDKKVLKEIPNLIYRQNGEIITNQSKRVEDLNTLPRPVYDTNVYPAMKGDQKIKMILVDESRGCPNSCHFCLHPQKSGNKWRVKSPEKIVNEIETYIQKYGIKVFRFTGSNSPPHLIRDVSLEILKRDIKVEYACFAHLGSNQQDFDLMKKSGCYSIWFGIESGSPKILNEVMNKKNDIDHMRQTLRLCKKAGIFVTGSIIIPAPKETEQTKQKTFDLLRDTSPDSVIVGIPVIIQGTEWSNNRRKYGINIPDIDKFFKLAMTYKIKLLYPPALWPPFPYFSINGKDYTKMMQEAEEFSLRLTKEGIITQVSNDTALLAKCYGVSAEEFRDLSRQYFSLGENKKVLEMTAVINKNITGNKDK